MLLHPGTAGIDCDDCVKWIYDLKTGEKQTRQSGPTRELVPYAQPGPPPCDSCPKKPPGQSEPMSPEAGKAMELTPQNWKCWRHFTEGKAVGLTPDEKADPIVRRNFAMLTALTEAAEKKAAAQSMAGEMVLLINQMRGNKS